MELGPQSGQRFGSQRRMNNDERGGHLKCDGDSERNPDSDFCEGWKLTIGFHLEKSENPVSEYISNLYMSALSCLELLIISGMTKNVSSQSQATKVSKVSDQSQMSLGASVMFRNERTSRRRFQRFLSIWGQTRSNDVIGASRSLLIVFSCDEDP